MTENTNGGKEKGKARHSSSTALPHPQQTQQHKTEEERERYEGNGQCEGERHNARCQTQSEHGNTQPITPAIQQGHRVNDKGDTNTQTGTPTFDGESVTPPPFLTMPPTIRYAAPPSTTAPPTTTTRGERTEDTPPHEHHRHTSTTHTPHTRQGTLCDMTAVLASTAMGRVGHEPHHRTGQDSSSTHHRHSTHRGGWTPSTHPLIYSYSFTFTQQMINVDQ